MEQTCAYPHDYSWIPDSIQTLPVDSLWGKDTFYITGSNYTTPRREKSENDSIMSGLFLAFFIVLIIFSKEIINVYPSIIKSFFKLKNHEKIEERLAISNQRNIVVGIFFYYYPLMLSLTLREQIVTKYNITPPLFFLILLGTVICLWLVRKGALALLSWLLNENYAFNFIEKISYNYFIISVFFTFPISLASFFWPELDNKLFINLLIYCVLFVYFIYLVKTWQVIRSRQFSLFFYILYLCTLEFLPIALTVDLILTI